MSIIVQKYGGSSVATAELIRKVAARVVATHAAGHQVVAVVSAMGKSTDGLLELARSVSQNPERRELDMLVTVGERISMALLSMAITDLGYPAVSFTGSQSGIITTDNHTNARIIRVTPMRLMEALDAGRIVIVAGFQGVSERLEITSLGRGGSDTTAVAIAEAIDADSCELYTDVSGVFTSDPRLVPDARRMDSISFDELLEMTATGCPKPAMRSVEYARTHRVPLHVRSAFTWEPGTWVVEEDPTMEHAIISAVTHDTSEDKITVHGVPDQPGIAATLFRALAERSVNVDMIVQNVSAAGVTDISFTVPHESLEASVGAAESCAADLGAAGVRSDADIARVSVVGAGMKTNPGVAATVFETLAEAGINIEMISTSEIRISVVTRADTLAEAMRVVHSAFELDGEVDAIVYAGTGR
ncbi:MAG: aspartate kinase [Myxococcales bacterium]|nr:aspartate kinase [Myxococcales bacterium]